MPWYVAVDTATSGEWTSGFFINNNLNRFSNAQEGHGGFFLLPLIFTLVGLVPFVIFLGEVFKKRKQIFTDELVQFSFLVIAVFILFFSFSGTKLPNYPMPSYPFAAIILGKYISLSVNENIIFKKYPYYILMFIMITIPVAGYFAIGKEAEAAGLKNISFYLFIPSIIFCILIFILKKNEQYIFALCFSYTLFNIIGLWVIYPELYSQNPVSKTIGFVKNNDPVFAYKIYNAGYNFYLNKNVIQFFNEDSLRNALQKNPGAIIISRKDAYDSIKTLPIKIVASHHDIFELPTTIILKQDAKP